ncbi:MAG: hypothetical protein AB1772_07675 [Candidatus Zixiibacteriota bacterium]
MIKVVILVGWLAASSFIPAMSSARTESRVDSLARDYVRLVLSVGEYVPDYVDAYFGPPEFREEASKEAAGREFPYQKLVQEAERLLAYAEELLAHAETDSRGRRLDFLRGQLNSLLAVLDWRNGVRLTFDQEAQAIYGIVAPQHDSAYYEDLLMRLDSLVPGRGDLFERFENLQKQFVVPRQSINTLIKLCVAECRERTCRFIDLPEGENCRIELVGGKSWGGYNWYLGSLQSLIQVDTSGPVYAGSLIGIAAHEGYPGHHCANVMREKILVQDSGWVEFSVIPLYCPSSVLDEGMASYASALVFPLEERVAFYKRILPQFMNLDTAMIDTYCRVLHARKELSECHVDAARAYLDGTWDSLRAARWVRHFDLGTDESAAKSLAFSRDYRSYRVTYVVGEQLVGDFILRHGGAPEKPDRQWELFQGLLEFPFLSANLKQGNATVP